LSDAIPPRRCHAAATNLESGAKFERGCSRLSTSQEGLMKRFALTVLTLALLPGLALAQNINRSLQGSQDPRGPVGIDTNNSAYFPGHINAFGQITAAPSPANCGSLTTPSSIITAGSTDAVGSVLTLSNACQ